MFNIDLPQVPEMNTESLLSKGTRQERLLVLGGFAQHCEIIRNAKSKGYYVIVVDYLEDSPGKKLADESYLISITDVDAIVHLCRERGIDGVMNYCIDPGQKPYQMICERLGMPCYGTKEQFDVVTNKDVFHEMCIRYGIDVVPRYHIGGVPTQSDLRDINFPVIVKPTDGRGSKGVVLCHNATQLPKAIDNAMSLSKRKRILVEKYVDKPEVCAKYFVCDGEIYLTSFSDTYTCYFDGQRIAINGKYFPSKYSEQFTSGTDLRLRRMIRGLGIRNGPLSFTGFFDDGRFRFFDPSFRLGGAQQWRVEAHVTGVDVSQCLTRFALTGSMGNPQHIRRSEATFADKCAGEVFILVRTGRIGRIDGLDDALNVSSVIGHYISHAEGDVISDFGTTDHVVATILLVSETKAQLIKDMMKIQELVKITDEHGENMLYPPLDVSLL